jgi:hypothetical protein
MENVHAERSAGWSVLCYVVLVNIATWIVSPLPSVALRPADVALLIDAHRSALLLNAWLTFPAAAFFLWFLVGLRSYLSNAPGRQEGLPSFAFAAGIVMVASSMWSAALLSAAVYAPADLFKANGLVGIYDAFVFMQGALGFAPVAIFLFAAAHSMRRHDRAPGWLASIGYLAALGAGFATLSIFFSSDLAMAPGQEGPGLFGAIPAGIWLIATGVVLIQSKPSGTVSSTSAAS